MRYGKVISNDLRGVTKGKIYKCHDNGILLDHDLKITNITIVESTEIEYAIQEDLDLTGRYLKSLVDSPASAKANKDDILLVISRAHFKNITTNDSMDWVFKLNTMQFELLPKDYKPGDTINNRHKIFKNIPIKSEGRPVIFRKALPHEIPSDHNTSDKPCDDFVLPGKWYFKITEENYEKFKHKRSLLTARNGYITSGNYSGLGWGMYLNDIDFLIINKYTEITFEQFQKHVLKEVYVNYDNDKEYGTVSKPYPEKYVVKSDDGVVDLYIPEVKEVPLKVDYSVSVKLIDIKLPDFSVQPEKIEVIKVEPYKLYI